MMKSFSEILQSNSLVRAYWENEYKSDKGHGHGFIVQYGELLAQYQHQPICFCEVGVAAGGSLHLWDKYFTHPATVIYGVDIQFQHGLQPWEEVKSKLSSRVRLIEKSFRDLEYGDFDYNKFDVVLDDASHMPDDQLAFMHFFHQVLKLKGTIIVEDVLPDDWPNCEPELLKTNASENKNVINLLRDFPESIIIDNRRKPRFPEWGDGNFGTGSISVVYQSK